MMKCLSYRSILVGAAAALAGCVDAPTSVDMGDAASARRPAPTVEVWSPVDGARVSGSQTFRARVATMDASEYDMFWQVDGGALTRMTDSQEQAPHKQAVVDVSAFNWRGAGPYQVTFVARDRKGKTMAHKSVGISVDAATPPPVTATNPFANTRLWVDPNSRAKQQADAWRAARPLDAAQMDKIAAQPQPTWFTGWANDMPGAVATQTARIVQAGALPLFVAYNIPVRDCGSYSAGGAATAEGYRMWIRGFAAGLGSTRAVIILEPDALAAAGCLSATQREERYALIADAVAVFKQQGSVVYIDAGNPRWLAPAEIAHRLQRAGIAEADGFALNVSNFFTTSENITYGVSISALLGGKRFVIDTSRNGAGPTADLQWCNPNGRALGAGPTIHTGHELVDALLWIKKPGESDGACNGGPSAGQWWADYALGLAQRAPTIVAYGG